MTAFNQDFTVRGNLRIEARHWKLPSGDKGAQVLCFADIEWGGAEFLNVLLLKLEIEGSQDDGWTVMDDFAATSFPYMKPVRAFRWYLMKQLKAFAEGLQTARSPWCPLWMGISQYVSELETFDEIRSLLRQLGGIQQAYKRKLGRPSRTHEGDLRAIRNAASSLLLALDMKPGTKRHFQEI